MRGQWILKEHRPSEKDGKLLRGCLGLENAIPTDKFEQGVQIVIHLDC